MLITNKFAWYEAVNEYIEDNLEEFYGLFGDEFKVSKIGKSYRVNPCPICYHKESFTVTGDLVNCFSGDCNWKGTNIKTWIEFAKNNLNKTPIQALNTLEKFSHIKFPRGSSKEMEEYEKQQTKQTILDRAEAFYHNKLKTCNKEYSFKGGSYTPLNYLLQVRQRKTQTINDFMIGFSDNYLELFQELTEEGFTKEEIKEAKVWFPEGIFIYFYRNPITRDVERINTKNPFELRYVEKDKYGNETTGDIIKGFSVGSKVMYYSPAFSFNEDIIVVEGENDLQALYEQGETNVCATGGTIEQERFYQLKPLEKCFKTIYLMYDNDDAGSAYVDITNDFLADKDVKQIIYKEDFKDPDEYFKSSKKYFPVETLKQKAKALGTDKFKIYNDGRLWTIANRDKRLEFTIKNKTEKSHITGNLVFYVNGVMSDRENDISLMKAKTKIKPLNFFLYDEIEKYFNENFKDKNLTELMYIYNFSSKKIEILRVIAERISEQTNDMQLQTINNLKIILGEAPNAQYIVDTVLKEINDIQNKNKDMSYADIPKIKLCHYFNIKNNDAYVYFNNITQDGDSKRKLPFLLRNDGTVIRLDLLKRKDSQCLLLVDNKYELPFEVKDSILDLRECSLTQIWAEKFAKGQMTAKDLEPGLLVKAIEGYIRKFYFTKDSNIYKVLSLYIYTTYFYELFGQIPYLYLNGEKGSGKSVLDTTIYMLAFDAKMAVDISESSLFRMVSVEGGTIILDEMENLTSRSKSVDNTMAAALKGGYARSGLIYRFNKEKNVTEGFNVYGPKVISNIFGIDDVIEDRCIAINTYRAKISKDTKLMDPKYFLSEKLEEVRELTSKCALSSLVHFQELHKIYEESLFETGNARLSQIMTPLIAIAKLSDRYERLKYEKNNGPSKNFVGDYEQALINFYHDVLAGSKEGIDFNTPEGIIKRVVRGVAKELYGLTPESEKEYTIFHSEAKYSEPIKFNKEEGWFEVDALHFKTFIEQSKPGESVVYKFVPRWVRTVFDIPEACNKRKSVVIKNEELIREMNGSARVKIQNYRFFFSDFIDTNDEFLKPKKDKPKKSKELF